MTYEPTVRAATFAKINGTFFPILSICVIAFALLHFQKSATPEFRIGASIWAAIELFLLYVVFFESKMCLPVGFGFSVFTIVVHLPAVLSILGLTVKELFSEEHEKNDVNPMENNLIVLAVLVVLLALHVFRSICVWIMYKWSRSPNNPKLSEYGRHP